MKVWHAILGILLVSAICLQSCRTVTEYVPVERVRIDTLAMSTTQVDSILQRDSIYIIDRGDTITEYRYKYLYKYKYLTDTVYRAKTDTVSVPYPVEKKLSAWEQTKVNYGGYAMLAILVIVIVYFGNKLYRIKKGGV